MKGDEVEFKGVRLYADLGVGCHNFFVFWIWMMQFGTERADGCCLVVLKGFFANINMRPGNPMDSSGVVVELAVEWLSFLVKLASCHHKNEKISLFLLKKP